MCALLFLMSFFVFVLVLLYSLCISTVFILPCVALHHHHQHHHHHHYYYYYYYYYSVDDNFRFKLFMKLQRVQMLISKYNESRSTAL